MENPGVKTDPQAILCADAVASAKAESEAAKIIDLKR